MNRIFKVVAILSLFSLASMDAVRIGQRRPVFAPPVVAAEPPVVVEEVVTETITPAQAAQVEKAVKTAVQSAGQAKATSPGMARRIAKFGSNVAELSRCSSPTWMWGSKSCDATKVARLKSEVYAAATSPAMKKAAATVVGLGVVIGSALYLTKRSRLNLGQFEMLPVAAAIRAGDQDAFQKEIKSLTRGELIDLQHILAKQGHTEFLGEIMSEIGSR